MAKKKMNGRNINDVEREFFTLSRYKTEEEN